MQIKRKAKRFWEKAKAQPVSNRPVKKGFGYEMPPERLVVTIYFDQKGLPDQAGVFYEHYEQANWSSPKGTPYRNWKLLAGEWIYNYEQALRLQRRLRTNALATGAF